jgi:hypothetical protein
LYKDEFLADPRGTTLFRRENILKASYYCANGLTRQNLLISFEMFFPELRGDGLVIAYIEIVLKKTWFVKAAWSNLIFVPFYISSMIYKLDLLAILELSTALFVHFISYMI